MTTAPDSAPFPAKVPREPRYTSMESTAESGIADKSGPPPRGSPIGMPCSHTVTWDGDEPRIDTVWDCPGPLVETLTPGTEETVSPTVWSGDMESGTSTTDDEVVVSRVESLDFTLTAGSSISWARVWPQLDHNRNSTETRQAGWQRDRTDTASPFREVGSVEPRAGFLAGL